MEKTEVELDKDQMGMDLEAQRKEQEDLLMLLADQDTKVKAYRKRLKELGEKVGHTNRTLSTTAALYKCPKRIRHKRIVLLKLFNLSIYYSINTDEYIRLTSFATLQHLLN